MPLRHGYVSYFGGFLYNKLVARLYFFFMVLIRRFFQTISFFSVCIFNRGFRKFAHDFKKNDVQRKYFVAFGGGRWVTYLILF